VTNLKVAFQGTSADMVDTWDLSADGKGADDFPPDQDHAGGFTQKTVFNKK
jgi:hypothetical protein